MNADLYIPRKRRRPSLGALLLNTFTLLTLFAILAPILVVVILAFTAGDTLQFPPPDWSLRWFEAVWTLFHEPGSGSRLISSLFASLKIGVLVAIIGLIMGIPAAYALTRLDFRGRFFLDQAVSIPLAFPLVVLGVALLVMISSMNLDLGVWRIVVPHIIITMPYVVRNCAASVAGIDASLEEAGTCLGATRIRTFLEVLLPLMRPGILAGGLMAFIISFNEFTVAYFLYTVDVFPFPIWLFTKSNSSLDPIVFAVSAIIVAFDAIAIWILDRLVGRDGVAI